VAWPGGWTPFLKMDSTDSNNTLSAKDLNKSFGRKKVVKGVSLTLRGGEVVGILGPNGAGKTTTFYMLAGLDRPESGKVLLNNKDITAFRLYKRARSGISFLPQQRSLFRDLTVVQNVKAVLELKGLDPAACLQRAKALLDEFNLLDLSDRKAATLSGGEARRLEIARAVALEPSFVLMDEPFAGIDPITIAMVQHLVKVLKGKGMGILISDHNVRDTLKICDRAYIMNEGQITASGTAKELVENKLVRKIYLGDGFHI